MMAINVTATWRLIRSLEPLLVRSDAGRALILSSSAGAQVQALLGALLRLQGCGRALARTWATRRSACRCASSASIRAHAHRHAGEAVPGEDPETLSASLRGGPGALAAAPAPSRPRRESSSSFGKRRSSTTACRNRPAALPASGLPATFSPQAGRR
ncbi:hypothetical protein F2981_11570 [Sinorhizobium meliloti]|nr:hypothetical protein [Sinorhizobium meliloti]